MRDHVGHDIADDPATTPASFGRGAALLADGVAWILLDDQPERGLGAALAWFGRHGASATELAVVTDRASGLLARRAALFAAKVSIWHTVERLLVPAVAEPHPAPTPVAPEHEALRPLIVAGGAEPVCEHGVLAGEVVGLEVCRVVTDQYTGDVRLEVGIGAHDREAFHLMHGDRPPVEALAGVVATVREHRRPDASPHPLNRMAAERALRWRCMHEPELAGAARLEPVDPPIVRTNIKDPVPCVAAGEAADGHAVVAVFSTGIDLDLVPFAVDARAMHAASARLVLVVPERDASPITAAIAAMAIDAPSLLGL